MEPSREFLLAIGQAVRNARRERGMSQESLAEAAELTIRYVGAVERGERNASIGALVSIAHGLDMPLSQLLAAVEELLRK
jgi:XRE family transcriptional regulator, regulator of sulfur utilization